MNPSLERVAVAAAVIALGIFLWSGRTSAPAMDPDDAVVPIADSTAESLLATSETYRLRAACYEALMRNGDLAPCEATMAGGTDAPSAAPGPAAGGVSTGAMAATTPGSPEVSP